MRRATLVVLAILFFTPISAQRASVQATVQPTEILIGEQALINLKVITPKDKTIQFPVYEKEIVPGIEVITMLPPDTTVENNVMTLNFKYVVTSFDSTLYHIPHMPVFDGVDTIYSNSFGLKVSSPQLSDSTLAYLEKINKGETDSIDFEQLQLHDIKPVRNVPFVWTDYLWVLWIVLGIMMLIALIGLIVYLVLKKKRKGYIFKPPVVLPAHVRAIQQLDKLKEEKIWQQGREKEFYSKLTDILRNYLVEREDINAMEMTSGEILNEVRKLLEVESVYNNLKQILSTADLVKFAKYKPYPDENDLSMVNAYFFVNQTREPDPVPQKEEMDKDKNEASQNDAAKSE
ncbi:hypothetical protein [Proteiniphilum sp. UBA1028]|jgi:hypothetical protein|uniref:hypothetical protein n=1 Tax=Proteiniphilum sp. UBA1028 TaxID=1947251 RepID=UPI000E8041F2|nr:hypothetical protein [Proteiniphilum sp. UBA1028]HBG56776.1 hypothetical protein [Porphyromonadaceae bacterium]